MSSSLAAVLDTPLADARSRLSFHAVDVLPKDDDISYVDVPQGINVSVILRGGQDISFPGEKLGLAMAAPSDEPECFITAFAEPDQIARRSRAGAHIRHVSIMLPEEWLASGLGVESEAARAVQDFARRHLAIRRWRPSGRLLFLAEQLLRPSRSDPLLQQLLLEAQTLEIVAEALQHITGIAGATGLSLTQRDMARLRLARDLLEREDEVPLSIADVARRVGVNPTTLQQQFRAVFGQTMFAVSRESRLQRAKDALERGLTVGQAAYLAGYGSPANFSTAFKSRFGVSPKFAKAMQRRTIVVSGA